MLRNFLKPQYSCLICNQLTVQTKICKEFSIVIMMISNYIFSQSLYKNLSESLIFTKHVTLLFCKNIYWYSFYIYFTSSYTLVGINLNIVPKYLCLLCIYLFANFQHNLDFFLLRNWKLFTAWEKIIIAWDTKKLVNRLLYSLLTF